MSSKPQPKRQKLPERLSESKEFIQFKQHLADAKRIVLSTHILPDGDGLGAEIALFHYLKRAKKGCRIANPDRLPPRYQILDPKEEILRGPAQTEIWDTFDLWIIVDTNDPKRLSTLWGDLSFRAKKIVFLDHHPLQKNEATVHYPPNAIVVSDTQSSSIGELLFHTFDELHLAPLSKDIAMGLYVSIMTDTNSFRYARTTPLAHRIAADTIEAGVNPEEVYQAIYSSKETSHLKLLGHMLQNIQVASKGRIAWLEIHLDLRLSHRASADDTQSFLNLLLLLKDAEVVCLFREEDDGKIRCSLKSKGRIIVNRIAMSLGGGGHDYAAGFACDGPLSKVVQEVTRRFDQELLDFGSR